MDKYKKLKVVGKGTYHKIFLKKVALVMHYWFKHYQIRNITSLKLQISQKWIENKEKKL